MTGVRIREETVKGMCENPVGPCRRKSVKMTKECERRG